jgi:hypothetical protein
MPKEKLDLMDTTKIQDMLREQMKGFEGKDQETVIANTIKNILPEKGQQGVAGKLGLEPPDEKTRNLLWKIVVVAFSIVLVGTFIILSIAMFMTQMKDAINLVKPEVVLSLFTAAVGFLAGLFVPSPAAKK